MNTEEIKKTKQAGQIAKQVRNYIIPLIKKDMLLLEIAEKIEQKISDLGGKPAFPTNLSINEIAAHYTPEHNDETKANGILKVDFGVHIDGFTADNAVSIDLENSQENKQLIKTAQTCLLNAINQAKKQPTLNQIGRAIQETAEQNNFTPIKNLSGHQIEQYDLHAGLTVPNYDNRNSTILKDGLYAIEPFVTTGKGKVTEGKPSGIYQLISKKPIRDSTSRQILNYIETEYNTLPFCSRWLVKKFGTRALTSLTLLERANIIHQYPQLIEESRNKVAQAEHTILIHDNKLEVTTE